MNQKNSNHKLNSESEKTDTKIPKTKGEFESSVTGDISILKTEGQSKGDEKSCKICHKNFGAFHSANSRPFTTQKISNVKGHV